MNDSSAPLPSSRDPGRARAPLHPALVHLPVALLPLSLLLDITSRVWREPELRLADAAFICLVAGILTAVLAAAAGMIDYTSIRDDHPAKKTATLHMVLNLVALGLFCTSLGLRLGEPARPTVAWEPLLVSLFATGVLACSGYLGGKLVYDAGIGVGRRGGFGSPPKSTLILPPPDQNAPVEIGACPLVAEGSTARVAVGSTIVAVARTRRKLCAFQEFCSHRHGPLSEGVVVDGEVVCPWHGSRFSTTTGKVIAGPAKVDLRTFAVGEHAGKVWLHVDDETDANGDPRAG